MIKPPYVSSRQTSLKRCQLQGLGWLNSDNDDDDDDHDDDDDDDDDDHESTVGLFYWDSNQQYSTILLYMFTKSVGQESLKCISANVHSPVTTTEDRHRVTPSQLDRRCS